jgi:hypothetical protein
MPYDVSAVMTWESDQARGLAHRGRIYPPNVPQLAGGKIIDADVTLIANAGVSLIDLLGAGDAGATTAIPSILSSTDQAFRHIFAVSVDNIPDVQGRRDNAITGSRVTVNV